MYSACRCYTHLWPADRDVRPSPHERPQYAQIAPLARVVERGAALLVHGIQSLADSGLLFQAIITGVIATMTGVQARRYTNTSAPFPWGPAYLEQPVNHVGAALLARMHQGIATCTWVFERRVTQYRIASRKPSNAVLHGCTGKLSVSNTLATPDQHVMRTYPWHLSRSRRPPGPAASPRSTGVSAESCWPSSAPSCTPPHVHD